MEDQLRQYREQKAREYRRSRGLPEPESLAYGSRRPESPPIPPTRQDDLSDEGGAFNPEVK